MLNGFIKGLIGKLCWILGAILILAALIEQDGGILFLAIISFVAGSYLKYVSRNTVKIVRR